VADVKAHVLITNAETFPVCRDRLFWGIGTPDCPSVFEEWVDPTNSRKPYLKMLVDMMSVSTGDLIFLYERQAGFHGVYKAASPLFFDATSVSNGDGLWVDHQWPLRIRLECLYYFAKPVPEDLLFSTPRYENVFWIWAYRKSQGARGCNTITPEAAESLLELLVKVNGRDSMREFDPYVPPEAQPVSLPPCIDGERVALEDYLRGHISEGLRDREGIEVIFGPGEDIEWFANNVPYHITQKNIDLLVFHKNFRYTTVPLRYKYSVVELKKDSGQPRDVAQLIRYSQWASGRLANGEAEMIQPVLVAYDFSEEAVKKAVTADFNDRGVLLFKYSVQNQDVVFEKVDAERPA
jgi:hypothetical protein